MENNEKDLTILASLYYGNHLNDKEKERANALLQMLKVELDRRI